MIATLHPTTSGAPAPMPRYRRMFLRLYPWIMAAILPATVFALWMLTFIDPHRINGDVLGLIAVSIGIVGILVLYIFAYKCQVGVLTTIRARWYALGLHVAGSVAFFGIVIWMGFYSSWNHVLIWGTYDFEIASRSWIITIIVVGTITALGSFFDLMRISAGMLLHKDS